MAIIPSRMPFSAKIVARGANGFDRRCWRRPESRSGARHQWDSRRRSLRGLGVPVERGARNADRRANIVDAVVAVPQHGDSQFHAFPRELARSATVEPAGAGSVQSSMGALADHAAFKVSKGREYVKN